VPIITIIVGEGAGGALGIGVGDRVYIGKHLVFCNSPESCSSILWKAGNIKK
jgi:acetyl-CoA carboxylase alpha subunit